MGQSEIQIEEMKQISELDIADFQKSESKSLDIDKYEGKAAKIASYEIKQVPSKFEESGMAWRLFLFTEPVGTFGPDKKPIRASEMFGIRVKNGKPTWNDKSELQKLLDRLRVDSPKDVIGKSVILTLRVAKKKEGQKFASRFLGFEV